MPAQIMLAALINNTACPIAADAINERRRQPRLVPVADNARRGEKRKEKENKEKEKNKKKKGKRRKRKGNGRRILKRGI